MRLPRQLRRHLVPIIGLLGLVTCFFLVYRMTRLNNNSRSQLQRIVHRVHTDGIMDPLNEYTIIPNIVTPVEWGSTSDKVDITVCAHSTPDNLHYLKEMSKRWGGPISVTVLSYGTAVTNALYEILVLHTCYANIRKFVSFHLIVPVTHPPKDVYDILDKPINCEDLYSDSEYSPPNNFQDVDHPYPLNTMRNVAITYSNTEYIFMIDIDIMPSLNLAQKFQTFIDKSPTRTGFQKLLYVIPVFESKTLISELESKDDLLREYNSGNVRIYYVDDCHQCQETTNYHRWLSIPSSPEPEILYYVNRTYVWEPFYIVRKRLVPLYDGRFKRYGFNRISQICEAHMSGFEFVVMNNVFIVHDGFKLRAKFHPSRHRELEANRELFRRFKQEMALKYSRSTRTC